jgi:hypothetical protein
MNEEELKEYLKEHLQISLQLGAYDEGMLYISLYLDDDLITQSKEYMPFKSKFDNNSDW